MYGNNGIPRGALGVGVLPGAGVEFNPVLYVAIGCTLLLVGALLLRHAIVVKPYVDSSLAESWLSESSGRHRRIRR